MYSSVARTAVICAANDGKSRKEARQEFRKNIMDRRKEPASVSWEEGGKFVRSEVSETRSIFDEHVKFLEIKTRKNKKLKRLTSR